MISLETAKALRDAGLKWEPKVGDWFSGEKEYPMLVAFQSSLEAQYTKITNTKTENYPDSRLLTGKGMMQEDFIWLPRLDQLLIKIAEAKQGAISLSNGGGYGQWRFTISGRDFYADTPEEATAKALLRILAKAGDSQID